MARIEKIIERREKKLNISMVLSDELKEKTEDGELIQDDFITIKKIPYDVKTKIKFLSMKSFGGQTSKQMYKKLREKGKSLKDLENLDSKNSDEIMDFMLDIDYKSIESEEMANSTLTIQKYILDYGVDKRNHSFKDEKDNPIELNFDTLNAIGSEKMITFIINNIKTFSEGFMLGE